MEVAVDEVRTALVEEHARIGLYPKFSINDYGDGDFNIAITLDNKSWDNQSRSIDAMIAVRKRYLGKVS